MTILFVAARFPYPPFRGDQGRAFHQLRLLGARHKITLLTFADKTVTEEGRAQIAPFCDRVVTIPFSRKDMIGALARGAASPLPFQTSLYQTAPMRRAIERELATGEYDVAHIQVARMAPYFFDAKIPRVIDLIDALSLNMQRRADAERGSKKSIARVEAARLRRLEQRVCETFERATVVSPLDRAAIGEFKNLSVNANAVDASHFAFHPKNRAPDTLVFSGNMGYFPNVNAVLWFAREVLPLVRKEIPDVKFQIVGTGAGRALLELASDAAIEVTGFVEDLREYLNRATVAVAPMRSGSGMQNKVIEAMACGAPVVATSFALGGIEAQHAKHLLVGEDANAFAAQTVRLLHDEKLRKELARAARELVENKLSWEASVAQLEEIYEAARRAK